MTSITEEIVPKLRRAIGDTKETIAYSDNILSEYIEDAIDKLYIKWNHSYEVDRENHTVLPNVHPSHQILFVMQSKLDLITRKPDISFSAGSLSVTKKMDTQKGLSKEIQYMVNLLNTNDSIMVVSTEFDDYARKLEDSLYVTNLYYQNSIEGG